MPELDRRRLWAIARKETLQLRRDPRSLLLAFLLPVLLLVLFGYAITWDVEHIAVAVLDQDDSARSRALLTSLVASNHFDIVARLDHPRQIDRLLRSNRAQMTVVVPPDFAATLDGGGTAVVQAIVDGSDANTATIAIAYFEAIVNGWSRNDRAEVDVLRAAVTPQTRVWFNETLRSRNMIVPGLVAVIMMIIAAMLTSLTIAREWERGTMEQLASTPVSRHEIVLGKLLPYLAIGLVDVIAVAGLGVALFQVPFRGAPLLLLLLAFFFLTGALGLGLWISAIARSQLLATQLAMLLTFLPAYLLSGFMFAIEVMPKPLQLLTSLVPARYFLTVTRGIFLKGVGLQVLATEALLMLGFALLGLWLASRSLRKEIE